MFKIDLPAFQPQHDNHNNQPGDRPKIILSEEERTVLQQCNKESFWYRSKCHDEIQIELFSQYKLEIIILVRVIWWLTFPNAVD